MSKNEELRTDYPADLLKNDNAGNAIDIATLREPTEHSHDFTCFIMGGTIVLPKCVEILEQEGFRILGIITDSPDIISWANQKAYPIYPITENMFDLLSTQTCDYLFSIVNKMILSKEVLNLPKRLAINYHDAPLPRYAGVYTNSWALINQEKEYGISWHTMVERVDAGKILQQPLFSIDNDETVITLNIKCYEAAVSSFIKLVEQLTQNKLTPKSQDLGKRSFFSIRKRPFAGAILQWHQSAEEIDALYRALLFTPFDNPITCSKIQLDDHLYIIDELTIGSQPIMPSTEGKLAKCSEEELEITTTTKNIIVKKLLTLDGTKISLSEVISKHRLQVNQILPSTTLLVGNRIQDLHKKFGRYESFWSTHLSNLEAIRFPFWSSDNSSDSTALLSIPLPKGAQDFFDRFNYNSSEVLFTLFCIYLKRICKQKEFAIAYSSNLLIKETKGLEHYFATEVPLKLDFELSMTFEEVYHYLQEQKEDVQKHLGYTKDLVARKPQLHHQRRLLSSISTGVGIREVTSENDLAFLSKTGLDLLFSSAHPNNWGSFAFSQNRIESDEVSRIISHLQVMFGPILADPFQLISQYPLVSQQERHILLDKFNRQTGFSFDKTLIDLFDEQVQRTPDNIAVIYKNSQLSYRQLDKLTDVLAHYLETKYLIQPNDIIALLLEPSEWMIVAILSIMKSGAAYLPIASDTPIERASYILKDSEAKALISDKQTYSFAQELSDIISIEIIEEINHTEAISANRRNSPNDLAYIIYTSGSTGKPKGVMIEHAGVANLIKYEIKELGILDTDRILQFTTYTFDTAVEEIFLALLSGSAIVLADKDSLRSPGRFLDLVNIYQITVLDLPPRFLNTLNKRPLYKVRVLFTGGEAPIADDVEHYSKQLKYFNGYGPTETTIVVSIYLFPSIQDSTSRRLPIGKPVDNIEILILDSANNLVPVGVIGELCVAGNNLARGYLNQAELTKKHFTTHPFKENERLYKTGDMARWLSDGNIEFFGREDSQVNIKGFRVELGEIEHVLLSHTNIIDAIVTTKTGKQQSEILITYVVFKTASKNAVTEVRSFLKAKVPSYMIPTSIMAIESMPLDYNGKVNLAVLKEINSDEKLITDVELPKNLMETKLLEIYLKHLDIKTLGVEDNYFDIGGDSLAAVFIMQEIEDHYKVKISISLLYKYTTIRKLAEELSHSHYSPDENNTVIHINKQGSKDPIFFIHSISGSILQYKNIIKGIDSEYPVFGIQSKYSEELVANKQSIKELAANYIKEILPSINQNRLTLTGFSFGGIVAFEMALQLKKLGYKPTLIILDANMTSWYQKMHPLKHLVISIFSLSSWICTNFYTSLRLFIRSKNKKQFAEQLTRIRSEITSIMGHSEAKIDVPKQAKTINKIVEISRLIGDNYIPTGYDGDMHLIQCKEVTSEITNKTRTNFFKHFVNGKIFIHQLNTYHEKMLTEPYVSQVTLHINSILKSRAN